MIGSLREDAKIRYWHTAAIGEPWRNYYDNVLLPKGNYAGRVCHDPKGILLWNFFTKDADHRGNNLLPPPKRLRRCGNGQLRATTFEGIGERVTGEVNTRCIHSLKGDRKETFCRVNDGFLRLTSRAGFQGFVFDEEVDCFLMRCRLSMTGAGKCGILSRVDPRSHDGYYLSLDLMKGIAQARAWGTNAGTTGECLMRFDELVLGEDGEQDPGARVLDTPVAADRMSESPGVGLQAAVGVAALFPALPADGVVLERQQVVASPFDDLAGDRVPGARRVAGHHTALGIEHFKQGVPRRKLASRHEAGPGRKRTAAVPVGGGRRRGGAELTRPPPGRTSSMSEKSSTAFTIPSLLAIVAAIASFFQGATFGLLLALAAIVFGLLGVLLALSARKRGGIVSLLSILFGLVGIIAAVIKAMIHLFG